MIQDLYNQDTSILTARQGLRDQIQGPRTGDFVSMKDGTLRRFTHDWGDAIQVISTLTGCQGFYLHHTGHLDYSGGLDAAILETRPRPTGKMKPGGAWLFHHDAHRAHNGIDVTLPCRVFEEF